MSSHKGPPDKPDKPDDTNMQKNLILKKNSKSLLSISKTEEMEPQNLLKTEAYARAEMDLPERSKESRFNIKLGQLKKIYDEDSLMMNRKWWNIKDNARLVVNYLIKANEKVYAAEWSILEVTTRVKEICNYKEFKDWEKLKKKFYSIPYFTKEKITIKSWLRSRNICKKVMKFGAERKWRERIDMIYLPEKDYKGRNRDIKENTSLALDIYRYANQKFPEFKKAEIPEKRYEPIFTVQKITVQNKELPPKFKKFKIYQPTVDKIWNSEIPYDITSEIKFQLKIATDIWWTQKAFDKFNKRGYEKLANITPCMPRFDIGLWIESQIDTEENTISLMDINLFRL
jgi:hypothetical protein